MMRVACLLLMVLGLAAGPAAAEEQGPTLQLRSAWLASAPVALPSLGGPAPALPGDGEPAVEAKARTKKSKSSKGKSSSKSKTMGPRWAWDVPVQPPGTLIGFGGQIGAPTGFTLKVMLLENMGIQAGVGAGVGWVFGPALSLYCDFLWHPHVLATAEAFKLSWYVGGGVWAGFNPLEIINFGGPNYYSGYNYFVALRLPSFGTSLGGRVPVGLSLALQPFPIEIYGEIVPSVLLFPAIGLGLGGGVGLRYYF